MMLNHVTNRVKALSHQDKVELVCLGALDVILLVAGILFLVKSHYDKILFGAFYVTLLHLGKYFFIPRKEPNA